MPVYNERTLPRTSFVYTPPFAALIALFAAAAVNGYTVRDAETRGMWVLRTSLASPAAIDRMVRSAGEAGINTLFVQVRGRGDAYFASALEPRGALLASQPAAFDPLARVIHAAHARGIAVHAWLNVGLVSDASYLPAESSHLIRRHPEWLMVPRELAAYASAARPRDGAYVKRLAAWTRANLARVEGLYVSPMPAGARAHAIAVARDLARRYPLDGLHLDYVRYPHDGFDYSAAALAEFRAFLGEDGAAIDLPDRFPEKWSAFRRSRVTALVAGIAGAARAVRPGILISAAVVPDPQAAVTAKLQDWPDWAARGLVDALCPMAYAEERPVFTSQVEAMHQANGTIPIWTGIGAYRLSSAETASRILEARRAGAAGFVLFSYDSVSAGKGGSRYLIDVAQAVLRP